MMLSLNNRFGAAFLLLVSPTLENPFIPGYFRDQQVAVQRLSLEEMTLPLDLQVSLLFKALTFDISHEGEFKQAGYRIAIVYASEEVSSVSIQVTFTQFLAKYPQNRPLTYFPITFTGPDQFRDSLVSNRINIVYICPGMSRNIAGIVDVSRQLRVMTATGVEKYVKDGVALGLIGAQEKGAIRPRYSVNRLSAKFDADFLDQAFKTYP